jgi:CHAD domain-containing protein
MKLAPISKYALKETRVCLQRFKKNLRHTAKHPEDPDAIHDLRVSIRRLSQCFRTFRGLLDPVPVKQLRRRLHKLMDLCAAVRNCDVALSLLHQVGITEGVWVSKLKETREDAGRRLHRHLKKERRRHHPAVGASPRPPHDDWKLDQSPEDNLRRVLPTLVEGFFAAGTTAAVAGASPQTMHQFRLSSKRFRYALELFERFYGSEMARSAKALKGLQDRLGAINDCVTTIDLLGRDRRAVTAVRKLLGQRTVEFQSYWRSQFAPWRLAWWKRWLSRPDETNIGDSS